MGDTRGLHYGRMSPAHFHPPEGVILKPCLRRSQRAKFQCLAPGSGRMPGWCEAEELNLLGACTIPNISGRHSGAGACSLSGILEEDVPGKYFLSPKACAGILKRAELLGRALPPLLEETLKRQAACIGEIAGD